VQTATDMPKAQQNKGIGAIALSPCQEFWDPALVAALLAVLKEVPVLTWGRDELGTGEMWNSNSVVAWALARTGLDMDTIQAPAGGRAPGWRAGQVLAQRQASVGTRV
jgi:hypothetical protein